MESTPVSPYCPISQHYEPEKIPQLFFKDDKISYVHSHQHFEVTDIPYLVQNFEKTISNYAHIKYDIDHLNKLLKNSSIKSNSKLFNDLIKTLNEDQRSLLFLSDCIDLWEMKIITFMRRHPLSLLESEENQKEGEKEKDGTPTPLPSTVAPICHIFREENNPSISFTCVHTHPGIPKFKTYQQLCKLIISLKGDLAYFNNIEHSEEWAFYSTQSEELKNLFQFKVEIEKNKDEIYLQIIEKIEQIAKKLFFKISLKFTQRQLKILQSQHLIPLVDGLNKRKDNLGDSFHYCVTSLRPVIPKAYIAELRKIDTLDPMSINSWKDLLSIVEEILKIVIYPVYFATLAFFISNRITHSFSPHQNQTIPDEGENSKESSRNSESESVEVSFITERRAPSLDDDRFLDKLIGSTVTEQPDLNGGNCNLDQHVSQYYDPKKIPKWIVGDETFYVHSHEDFEGVVKICYPMNNFRNFIYTFAHVKYDIDHLRNLLENLSIKSKPKLFFDLTKILSEDQRLISILTEHSDEVAKQIINEINPSQLLDSIESQKQSEEGAPPKICLMFQEDDSSFSFTFKHFHPENYKTYQQLCQCIFSLKADIAYFNNIENSEEWTYYSQQSEEIKKMFKFTVEIEKNCDEFYLQILEKVEEEAKKLFIKTQLRV
jgi:hypothetical protein